MKRDHRITKVNQGEFRFKLSLEDFDIKPSMTDAFNEGVLSYVAKQDGNLMEEVLMFLDNPVKLPYLSYLYYSKIGRLNDPLLYTMVRDYVYMNPSIDQWGIKKMTEHIIKYNVKHVKDNTRGIYHHDFPVLSFEDIYEKVTQYVHKAEDDKPHDVAQILVAYKRDSIFTKEEKIVISKRAYYDMSAKFKRVLIHNAVNYFITMESDMLKITNPRIINKVKENSDKKNQMAINTLKNHISNETLELIDCHNEVAVFKTEITYDKYLLFLPIKMLSASAICKSLSVSRTTVIKFKEIDKQFNNR